MEDGLEGRGWGGDSYNRAMGACTREGAVQGVRRGCDQEKVKMRVQKYQGEATLSVWLME